MAGRADILVDGVAALKLGVVIGTERTAEGPILRLDLWCVARSFGCWLGFLCGLGFIRSESSARRESKRDDETGGKREFEGRMHPHATGSGARRCGARFGEAGLASCGPSTDSVMLPGSPFGFSIQPTTGITKRKNRK